MQLGDLIGNYSAMTVSYTGTANGISFNLSSSYQVVSSNSTINVINIIQHANTTTLNYTAWVLKNGTAVAVDIGGYKVTGYTAQSAFFGAMATFFVQLLFSNNLALSQFTSLASTHVVGTSTVNLGPTSVMVTSYEANSLPVTFGGCYGTSTLDAFSIKVGTVQGKTMQLVTYLRISGSLYGQSINQNVDFTLAITSVTKA